MPLYEGNAVIRISARSPSPKTAMQIVEKMFKHESANIRIDFVIEPELKEVEPGTGESYVS